MKSILTAFAALAALALPAGLPTLVMAQEVIEEALPRPNDAEERYQPESSEAPVQAAYQERPQVQELQDRRGDRSDDRDDGGNGGGESYQSDEPLEAPVQAAHQDHPEVEDVQDHRGGDRGDVSGDRSDDRDDGGNGGGNDNADENAGDWNRGGTYNGNAVGIEGGRENATSQDSPQRVAPRGSFADSCSGSYVNQGRLYADCRDTRGNVRGTSIELARCSSSDIGNDNGLLVCHNVHGDFENRGGNNGGWDRDRNGGGRYWNNGRSGRRDYGGFDNRWNQDDWHRNWSRGRSNDWWRNDRGFQGYSGYRSGFYFAPNYGYYSVPRNYWGQRWYQGDYLPSIFRRYRLSDYRTYGLGYPPPGTQWVAVDTTIYLIDSYDGYILNVIYDAWRW